MESELLDVHANVIFRYGEIDELKIDVQGMRDFLLKRFGIAGLIHSYSAMCIMGYDDIQDRAKHLVPLAALEKLLQQDPNRYTETLG